MPLFGRKHETVPTNAAPTRTSRTSYDSNHRRSTGGTTGGFFSRHRNSSTSSSDISTHNRHSNRHNHHTNTNTTTSTTAGSGLSNLFHRNSEDPSIATARERVMAAERAERDADAALMQARQAVRDAKDHVRTLELEAKEEARLAKIKQRHANDLSKRAKPLGRKFF